MEEVNEQTEVPTDPIDALTQALQKVLASTHLPTPAPRRAPKFAGSPEEGPRDFLVKAENYFQQRVHPEDVVASVAECLNGAAAAWFKSIRYELS